MISFQSYIGLNFEMVGTLVYFGGSWGAREFFFSVCWESAHFRPTIVVHYMNNFIAVRVGEPGLVHELGKYM